MIAAPDKRREVLRLCIKMALCDGNTPRARCAR